MGELGTRFLGVPLHDCDQEANFRADAADFANSCIEAIDRRFGEDHPVALATRFLDFFAWDWQNADRPSASCEWPPDF